MKVLKFGGTSVGTPASLSAVKQIVEATTHPVVVVVSALGGITDQLIRMSKMACAGDKAFMDEFATLVQRHEEMVEAVIVADERPALLSELHSLLDDLQSILQGVLLIQDLTPKTADAIVAYGERLSSLIAATLIDGAQHIDARTLIKTTQQAGKHVVDFEATNPRIGIAFASQPDVVVMGGFISSDAETGVTTNLGRGGSDYTAAILAAALNAEALEIWTDVDGFMTADPRVIPTAYPIERLSYTEAMELCNFGAKVVYPPTIYPVCDKNIPIYIKNTFNPAAQGSVITVESALVENRPVCGISSVNETSVVTVSGLTMVGVLGTNRRIFGCLSEAGVSVFMVAQSSSESSTSLCVRPEDGRRACEALDREFAKEMAEGAMNPALLEEEKATIAVVGEGMRRVPGTAGKLFNVLGRNGINVCASALGALENSLSVVVDRPLLRKALNVLHDSFFLSECQEINVFICGIGTVGHDLIQQIHHQQTELKAQRMLKVNVVGISSRSHGAIYQREGIDLAHYEQLLAESQGGGIEQMVERIIEMNLYNSVFVDCTACTDVADAYLRLLHHNISVVAANKTAASAAYEQYARLKAEARDRGVKFLFETNVGAGLPVINTINDLVSSGDRILSIEAVLSGTLNFVFNTLSEEVPFSEAVRLAKEHGYSEPDPRLDLNGMDVVRKITILARESGYQVETSDIERSLFIPEALFKGTEEEFWQQLPALDADFEARRQILTTAGRRWRFVAKWQDGRGSVGLQEIPSSHPFYNIEGSNNIVLLTTERYRQYPMLIQGYGAGAAVTAAGVFADIMRVANV